MLMLAQEDTNHQNLDYSSYFLEKYHKPMNGYADPERELVFS